MKKVLVSMTLAIAMIAFLSLYSACEDKIAEVKPGQPDQPDFNVLYINRKFPSYPVDNKVVYAIVWKEDEKDSLKILIKSLVDKGDDNYKIEDVEERSLDKDLFTSLFQIVDSSKLSEGQQKAFDVLKESLKEK